MLAADASARDRLAREVIVAAPGELMLRAFAEDDPGLGSLLAAASDGGRWTVTEPAPPSPVADTTGSLEDYRASLSSKVRSEVGRLRRKAEREHEFGLLALEPPHELDAQWGRALELEAAGWKGRSGTAILCRPQIKTFFEELTRGFDRAGALRLSELSLDGRLAAMALSIVHDERLFTLRVAYDEEHRRLGPGFVLLMAMIERCFELGLRAYEFSGTEEEYERRFATSERARCRVRVYRPGIATGSRYLYRGVVRPRLREAEAGGGESRRAGAIRLLARLLPTPPG
jgi:hypothetical protein